ncbi:jerky protein homolog [Portunus trituberculatus]|uniref:jerky protein homolog n=1 Tax=Portunus trituberculatus TaxID=210409 RepID=UPI001E1CC10F|nr:jerky protein homolog [Portunus trituberculatus]
MASKRPGSNSVVCEPKKKCKHMTISVQQKVDLLRKLDKSVLVRTLCQQHNIGSSTIYDIKKQKNHLLKFYSECESKKNMEVHRTLKEGS